MLELCTLKLSAGSDPDVTTWQFDPLSGELWAPHATSPHVRLEPQPARVLTYLARYAGRVVTRQELMAALWPDRVVVDDALTRCISLLRQAFSDTRPYRLIQTLPKRGYRLTLRVRPECTPVYAYGSEAAVYPGNLPCAGEIRRVADAAVQMPLR